MHFAGADRLLDGVNALRVPLCFALKDYVSVAVVRAGFAVIVHRGNHVAHLRRNNKVGIAADATQARLNPNVMRFRICPPLIKQLTLGISDLRRFQSSSPNRR